MKNFFVILVISVIALTSCASMSGAKAPVEDREMQQIVDVPGKDAKQLYVTANSWFVDTFNSAESVIEFQDKDAGIIKGKYAFEYWEGIYEYRVISVITVDVKDGRCRISFNNPHYQIVASGLNGPVKNGVQAPAETVAMLDKTRSEWSGLVDALKKALENESGSW